MSMLHVQASDVNKLDNYLKGARIKLALFRNSRLPLAFHTHAVYRCLGPLWPPDHTLSA
jgi:hypothetical protein